MKTVLTSISVGIMGFFIAANAHAVVPSLLPVQGVLADSSSQPVDDLVDMTFTIYPSEFGGIAVWSEVRDGSNQVDVEEGFFTVYLGEVQTLDMASLTDDPELWLGITVGTDSEMDRIRMATVPFAVEAHRCEQIGEITETDISGAPFYGISSNQVSNWDAAYGWGDHGAVGYVTAETDPLFTASAAATITGTQVADWDTAFAWGDHNGLYSPADHKHDDRYYTQTELQTAGGANVHYDNLTNVPAVDWNNLVNVPAGFADGTDDTDVGIEFAQGNQTLALTISEQTVRSISMTIPRSGYVAVTADLAAKAETANWDAGRCSLTTNTWIDFSFLRILDDHHTAYESDNWMSLSMTRTFSVSAGTHTFRIVCDEYTGELEVHDSSMFGIFVPNRY